MVAQNVFGNGSSPGALVDRMVGDAFPIVRHVSENLEYVRHVSAHLPQVYQLWEVRADVSLLAPSAAALLPLYNNIDKLIAINANLTYLNVLHSELSSLLNLNANTEDLLNAEEYIRSFEVRFGDADGAFAQATQMAVNAANTAIEAKNLAIPAAAAAQEAEANIDAFLMATTTEQIRMTAFIVEINNRTLV